MRRLCFFVVLAILALAAAPAGAAEPASRPPIGCLGNTDVAALDQYCAGLPSADGRGISGPRLREVLPAKLARRLEKAGPLGLALLSLRLAAPQSKLAKEARGRGLDADELLKRGTIGGGETKPSANPIKLAARAVSAGELEIAFGSLLLMSSFGIAGAGWRRFRQRSRFY